MQKAQSRVIIEHLYPEINGGKHFIKRVVGQKVDIEVDLYGDGHDKVNGELLFKHEKEKNWRSVYLNPTYNDRWQASFRVEKQGFYEYKVQGWVDHPTNWQYNLKRKIDDGQHVDVELLDGIQYLDFVAKKANKTEKKYLKDLKTLFEDKDKYKKAIKEALSKKLEELFLKYPYKQFATEYNKGLQVYVDRKKALFSAWYEFFPRSASQEQGRHGTFKDCELLMPRIAELGFDTVYFPPIHPIGKDFRKGKNNSTKAEAGDVGSPWAIGAEEGGHKAILSDLGTLEDFKNLVAKAKEEGIEIALDYALQCSPNHPYVKEHPQWFRWRPDGTVQYAENPPKKYQDILPINFETEDWKNLWNELKSILEFWIEQGVNIFRVDNPHTKAFTFWEWVIAEIKKKYPDTLFLSEAFTRPRVMHQLAKVGFTQSYTYYTWRNTKQELIEYMNELTKGDGKEYFKPNFWANTPDINPVSLQSGKQAAFLTRYFMSATLSSNYGMYGPVLEYMVHEQLPPKEEYMDSEKYEVKHWNWHIENKMTEVIRKVNKARKENPALQDTNNFEACAIENDQVFAYFKQDESQENNFLMVVNLDPDHKQGGWVRLPLEKLHANNFVMHDLISGEQYHWNQEWNYVELEPNKYPFHLLKIEKV